MEQHLRAEVVDWGDGFTSIQCSCGCRFFGGGEVANLDWQVHKIDGLADRLADVETRLKEINERLGEIQRTIGGV